MLATTAEIIVGQIEDRNSSKILGACIASLVPCSFSIFIADPQTVCAVLVGESEKLINCIDSKTHKVASPEPVIAVSLAGIANLTNWSIFTFQFFVLWVGQFVADFRVAHESFLLRLNTFRCRAC